MQTTVEVNMAQKYRISDKNDKEVFDFLKQNFGNLTPGISSPA